MVQMANVVIAFANGKGGTGKTTHCVLLVSILCEQGETQIIGVDLDKQTELRPKTLSERIAEILALDQEEAVCDAVESELRKRELEEKWNREIAELDRNLEQFRYSPGTAGFQMQADQALEVLKLERSGADEREALRLHPRAAAVLEEAAEYKKRDRGLGR
jgi:hypothetical protein